MRRASDHARRTGLLQRLRACAERPGRVDDVVGHHGGLSFDVSDHVGNARDIVRRPLLVQHDEVAADHLAELAGELRASRIRRDCDPLLVVAEQVAHVLGEHRHCRHVVDRLVEETLYLAGVQVHRQDAVDARGLEHVGNEARGDRLARPRLLVLARVEVPRDDGRDPLRGRELRRVDHDQQLHQVMVDVAGRRLDDEHVCAADRLGEADVRRAVGECRDLALTEVDAELVGDASGELGMGASGHDHQPLARRMLEPVRALERGLGFDLLDLEAREAGQLSRGAFDLRVLPC